MKRKNLLKKRMFRDFSVRKDADLGYNYLKNYRSVKKEICKKYDVTGSHLEFLLWIYDLDFFTIDYASKNYGVYKKNIEDRFIYPLVKQGYVYKYFDKLTPRKSADDQLFREETKFNYRVRYAMTMKGRLFIQRFYNAL